MASQGIFSYQDENAMNKKANVNYHEDAAEALGSAKGISADADLAVVAEHNLTFAQAVKHYKKVGDLEHRLRHNTDWSTGYLLVMRNQYVHRHGRLRHDSPWFILRLSLFPSEIRYLHRSSKWIPIVVPMADWIE